MFTAPLPRHDHAGGTPVENSRGKIKNPHIQENIDQVCKRNALQVHAMKGTKIIAPLILNLSARWS
jgi:hypothetical protein